MTLPTKHQRLSALRQLSPESVASLAAAWDLRMARNPDQFTEVSKLIGVGNKPHRSSSPGTGRDARATWRGRLARRRTDQFADLSKLILPLLP